MAMFESIDFVPDQFHEFLMDTVGFSSYKTLKVPEDNKGNWECVSMTLSFLIHCNHEQGSSVLSRFTPSEVI